MENESTTNSLIPQSQSSAVVEIEKQKGLATIMAMMAVAKRYPRDEPKAIAGITRACQRKGLAEVSQYTYSRGETEINGPSIHLLRAVAQSWGNVQSGWQEVERRPGESTVRTWAVDLENNTHRELAFSVRHWRDTKKGGYLLTDERDIYELLANQAARRERACLQAVIPQDIVDIAVEQCDKTLAAGGGVPIADRIRSMLAKFSELGVSKEQIEAKLGHNIEATKETELASLGKKFNSIRDGVGTVAELFPSVASASIVTAEKLAKAPKSKVVDEALKSEYIPTAEEEVGQTRQSTISDPLEDFIIKECGSSFDGLLDALRSENLIQSFPGMDSCPDFASIPEESRKRLLNAKSGLKRALKKSGGAV